MTLDISALTADSVPDLTTDEFRKLTAHLHHQQDEDRKHNQILYYQPAQPASERIHRSDAHVIGAGGGNRAAKTETFLVHEMALATGMFPIGLRGVFKAKFRGPINVRICIESLKTVLHPTLLPKLKWWVWTGEAPQGEGLGHWGWVPKCCLKDEDWDKSWSEKYHQLTVLCRDPDDPDRVLGESILQCMSYDQDAQDYASGTFDIVHMDEPPPYAIWRENQARVMDRNGYLFLSMTWPDDPSIGVDWIYDEVYEPGQAGPLKDPDTEWFELLTLENKFVNQQAILERSARWSDQEKSVRLGGQPLRFTNRIHPLFTDIEQTWCFTCGRICLRDGENCGCERQSRDICEFCHVHDFEAGDNWPVVFLLDPHPRKPHMMGWVAVDPSDDLHLVKEGQIDGDAPDVAAYVGDIEDALGLDVRLRLMDPNMGRSPSGARREVTWQDEFAQAGLMMDLADDSDVGRKQVNQYLKPDPHTQRPRLTFHPRCQVACQQMKRHVWDDFRRSADKDLKQQPKPKYSDYPALLKYCLNWLPTFRVLREGAVVLQRGGTRKGAY